MNILVLSNIEWSDNNAFGNTISNLFANSQNVNFASLYRRNSMPYNDICKRYYKISYTNIVRNIFTPWKIGTEFYDDSSKNNITHNSNVTENKLISFIHKWKLERLVHNLENIIFSIKFWRNKKFKDFIDDFSPDIIFNFTCTLKATKLIIEEIKKIKPDCKFVTFITDDVYQSNRSSSIRKTIRYQVKTADKVYAITPSLKEFYEKTFNTKIDILQKGCNFTCPVLPKNSPQKTIIYAGNLLYGREKTLIRLAEEVNKHNLSHTDKIRLEIYSPTVIDESIKAALNKENSCEFMGGKTYDEIVKILNAADIVLHVESFEPKQQEIVRNSFSTKIIDALQSGSVLFAIGAKGLASIDITSKINGAFVATSLEEISEQIEKIAAANLFENAIAIRKYSEEHFCINSIQQKLFSDFENIISGS